MRVPNVIKSIPTLIVRALPTLYYYGCYANATPEAKSKEEFLSYLNYLQKALSLLNEFFNDPKLERIIEKTDALNPDEPGTIAESIYDLTFQISQICQRNKAKLDQAMKKNNLEESLKSVFEKNISKRKVLVIDNGSDAQFASTVAERLKEKCLFHAAVIYPHNENIADSIIDNDFLLFTSAAAQSIHDQVAWLTSYKKPGLVLANLQKNQNLNQQIIRNGAWLRSRGIYVLFKIYTPLRLFTTIDKIFMRYLCQRN